MLEVARQGHEKQAASISSRALEMCKGKMASPLKMNNIFNLVLGFDFVLTMINA